MIEKELHTGGCQAGAGVFGPRGRAHLLSYRNMFRQTARLLKAAATTSSSKAVSAPRTKLTTGLTGLDVHPSPIEHLAKTYASTLSLCAQMPQGAVYRQACESITNERKSVVDRFAKESVSEQVIESVERELGQGQQIEEVIIEAEDELKLAAKMLEWKPYVMPND